ncbi:VanZ family protein [Hahella sp. SMD15-11]|uniref:VanZ family protein n=1 Tax=Thermohahella caldifontis TaxID=3142973 RepID=A0AB39USA3_9GAMM
MTTHPLSPAARWLLGLYRIPWLLWPLRGGHVLSLAWAFWLALRPVEELPLPDINDKVAHAVGLGALTLAAGLLHRRLPIAWLAALLMGYGIAIEVAQSFVPWRSASLADVMADALGVLIATVLLHNTAMLRQFRTSV